MVRVALSSEATIRCCYRWNKKTHVTWIMNIQNATNGTTVPSLVNLSSNLMNKSEEINGATCHLLFFKMVRLNDTGLYQCKLNYNSLHIFTHGTYLQIYSESDHSYMFNILNFISCQYHCSKKKKSNKCSLPHQDCTYLIKKYNKE